VHAFHPGHSAAEPIEPIEPTGSAGSAELAARPEAKRYLPGLDVRHTEFGPGWVQGSGLGRVTVRFERPDSEVGRVRTFPLDDPDLEPAEPLPLRPNP
jgi:DNA polymerase-4